MYGFGGAEGQSEEYFWTLSRSETVGFGALAHNMDPYLMILVLQTKALLKSRSETWSPHPRLEEEKVGFVLFICGGFFLTFGGCFMISG